MQDKQIIEDRYRQLYNGMIEKDRKLLSEILDGGFILAHMTGMKQSKEEFIRAIEDGTLNYYSTEHQNIDVRNISKDEAELTGQSLVNAAVFGGGRYTWRLQLNLKLKKESGAWLITKARASTY